MGAEVDDEPLEYTILNKPEVFVYRVPPRPPQGHRAENWSNCTWQGKLSISSKGHNVTIKLIDRSSGEMYAQCPVPEKQELAVERTVDSSRYFVIRLDGGNGRHAYVGMGFESRNDAFDFTACLADAVRRRDVEIQEAAKPVEVLPPAKDYSLKEGEKIKVEIKGFSSRKRSGVSMSDNSTAASSPLSALSPPPSAPTRRRSPPNSLAGSSTASPSVTPSTVEGVADDASFDCDFSDFQAAPSPTLGAAADPFKWDAFPSPVDDSKKEPAAGVPDYPVIGFQEGTSASKEADSSNVH